MVPHVQSYTEVASGLNFTNPATGALEPSKAEIDIVSGGACATNGQHKVYFPNDISDGAIKLVTADGIELVSRPIGISYDNGTNTVLIALLTNSIAVQISSNQLLYPEAFSGIHASLLYTYTKAGLSQDLVLEQQPPAPGEFSLGPGTRLQMLTLFNAPSPAEAVDSASDDSGSQEATLTFGSMKMGHGEAFLAGDGSRPVPVSKAWVALNGSVPDWQNLLVEQVTYTQISPEFAALPRPPSGVLMSSRDSDLYKVSSKRLLPLPRFSGVGTNRVRMAENTLTRRPGVILDYDIVDSNETNFVWHGDTTYYVSSSFFLFGNSTFEGGAVIKFAPSGPWTFYSTGPSIEIRKHEPGKLADGWIQARDSHSQG